MICTNCKAELGVRDKQCPGCTMPVERTKVKKGKAKRSKLIRIVFVIFIIGVSIFRGFDNDSIDKNNSALESFDSGDHETAIIQLQEASDSAILDDNKLNSLMSLGYIYASDGRSIEAKESFYEARSYAKEGTFDYYLLSGEIASLEGNYKEAEENYLEALNLNANDFQINNALNLFYLDMGDLAPEFFDPIKALEHAEIAYKNRSEIIGNVAAENLALAHYYNENFSKTIEIMENLETKQDPYIAYWLGWSYIGLGDEETAKLHFRRVVDAGIEVEQEVYDYLN